MSEILIKSIIDYIKNDISHERNLTAKLVQWLKITMKKEIEPNPEEYLNFLHEFKEIRRIYLKGKVFVKNHTKGTKKGFNSRKWDFIIKFYLNQGKQEMARTEALQHLNWTKQNYSKRTYFRHKAKIKSLGLDI
ncbi:MAG: hypothetical protein KGD57_07555 [Candidatus Lokiarchaeota archaeon]|nr:hypothetical protein [Candidatus Lokiarchaeota archaeon]